MVSYEYRVVPAPTRGRRTKAAKGPEDRFAHAIEALINEMAEGGWEYQRAETLPSEDRPTIRSIATTTTFRNLLVFRRQRASDAAQFKPRQLDSQAPANIEPQTAVAMTQDAASPAAPSPAAASDPIRTGPGLRNGDESLGHTLKRRAAQILGQRDDPPVHETEQTSSAGPDHHAGIESVDIRDDPDDSATGTRPPPAV